MGNTFKGHLASWHLKSEIQTSPFSLTRLMEATMQTQKPNAKYSTCVPVMQRVVYQNTRFFVQMAPSSVSFISFATGGLTLIVQKLQHFTP